MVDTKTTQGKKLYEAWEIPGLPVGKEDLEKVFFTGLLRTFIFGPVYTRVLDVVENDVGKNVKEGKEAKTWLGKFLIKNFLPYTDKLDDLTKQKVPTACAAVLEKFGVDAEKANNLGQLLATKLTNYNGKSSGQNYLETAFPFIFAASANNIGIGSRETWQRIDNWYDPKGKFDAVQFIRDYAARLFRGVVRDSFEDAFSSGPEYMLPKEEVRRGLSKLEKSHPLNKDKNYTDVNGIPRDIKPIASLKEHGLWWQFNFTLYNTFTYFWRDGIYDNWIKPIERFIAGKNSKWFANNPHAAERDAEMAKMSFFERVKDTVKTAIRAPFIQFLPMTLSVPFFSIPGYYISRKTGDMAKQGIDVEEHLKEANLNVAERFATEFLSKNFNDFAESMQKAFKGQDHLLGRYAKFFADGLPAAGRYAPYFMAKNYWAMKFVTEASEAAWDNILFSFSPKKIKAGIAALKHIYTFNREAEIARLEAERGGAVVDDVRGNALFNNGKDAVGKGSPIPQEEAGIPIREGDLFAEAAKRNREEEAGIPIREGDLFAEAAKRKEKADEVFSPKNKPNARDVFLQSQTNLFTAAAEKQKQPVASAK